MAVKIRLKRMGAKKKPFYRVIVADSRTTRDGKFIEELGYFDPLKDPAEIRIDGEKARKWIANGAQPTDTVRALLKKCGALEPPAADENGTDAGDAGTAQTETADAPLAEGAAIETAPVSTESQE